MAKFKDTAGREWDLNISVPDIRRVRDRCGVDFAALAKDPEAFVRVMLLESHELLPVVWALCQPRAKVGLGMALPEPDAAAEADFRAGIDADALDAAVVALWEEWGSMFRRTPVGMRIRQDGAAKAMRMVEAAVLGGSAEPPPAVTPAVEPAPVPADPPPVAAA